MHNAQFIMHNQASAGRQLCIMNYALKFNKNVTI